MQRISKRITALILALIMAIAAIGFMPVVAQAEENGYGYENEYLPYEPETDMPYEPDEEYVPDEYNPEEPDEDEYEDDDDNMPVIVPVYIPITGFGLGTYWNVGWGGRLDVIVTGDPVQDGHNLQRTINDPANAGATIFIPDGDFHITEWTGNHYSIVPRPGQTITGQTQGGVRIYDRIPVVTDPTRGNGHLRALVSITNDNVAFSNVTLIGPDAHRANRNPSIIRLEGNNGATLNNLTIDAINTRSAFTLVDANNVNANHVSVSGAINDAASGAGTGAVVISTSTNININNLNLTGTTITQHGDARHYAGILLCTFFGPGVASGGVPHTSGITITNYTPADPNNAINLRLPEPPGAGFYGFAPTDYEAARNTVDFGSINIPQYRYLLMFDDNGDYTGRFFGTLEEAQQAARDTGLDLEYLFISGPQGVVNLTPTGIVATSQTHPGGLLYGDTMQMTVRLHPVGAILGNDFSIDWMTSYALFGTGTAGIAGNRSASVINVAPDQLSATVELDGPFYTRIYVVLIDNNTGDVVASTGAGTLVPHATATRDFVGGLPAPTVPIAATFFRFIPNPSDLGRVSDPDDDGIELVVGSSLDLLVEVLPGTFNFLPSNVRVRWGIATPPNAPTDGNNYVTLSDYLTLSGLTQVSQQGVVSATVTGDAVGTAIVFAYLYVPAPGPGYVASQTFTINVVPEPTGLVRVGPEFRAVPTNGGTLNLSVTYLPDILTTLPGDWEVRWSSSDDTIATVDPATGLVTGMAWANGTVTITAELYDDGVATGLDVTFTVAVLALWSNDRDHSILVGDNNLDLNDYLMLLPLSLTGFPQYWEVRWYSINESAATIGLTTGIVTGVAVGSSTIVARLYYRDSGTVVEFHFIVDVEPVLPTSLVRRTDETLPDIIIGEAIGTGVSVLPDVALPTGWYVRWGVQSGPGDVDIIINPVYDNGLGITLLEGVDLGQVVVYAQLVNTTVNPENVIYTVTFNIEVIDEHPPTGIQFVFGTPTGAGQFQEITIEVIGTIPAGYRLLVMRTHPGINGPLAQHVFGTQTVLIDICAAVTRLDVRIVSSAFDYLTGAETAYASDYWTR